MSHLFPSYETSLRLKQAGAPQYDGEQYWEPGFPNATLVLASTFQHWSKADFDECCRVFRADETIEALKTAKYFVSIDDLTDSIKPEFNWCVTIEDVQRRRREFYGCSFVEALAAAWIAALEAK